MLCIAAYEFLLRHRLKRGDEENPLNQRRLHHRANFVTQLGYKYFLKLPAVTFTAMFSKIAPGSKMISGWRLKGSDR